MNNVEEITVILTRHCNLKCKFCNVIYDDHYNDDITVDIVMSKLPTITNIIETTAKPNINVVLMGGELFSDDIDDGVIESYCTLLDGVVKACNHHHKTLSISLMSNLITKRIERIINVSKRYKRCDIHGSFDFVGRFDNEKLIDLWWDNARAIKDAGIDFFVSIVGHKHNVQQITSGSPIWDKLYNQFGVYVQYYEPNNIANDYNLSFDEYRDFLIFLYDHYPEEKFLQSVINAYDHNQKTCCRSNWVDNSGCHKCCDHENVIKIYKQNHNCFICHHYNQCPFVCPRIYSSNNNCLFKPLFDHIKHAR